MSEPMIRYGGAFPTPNTAISAEEMKKACAQVAEKLGVRETDLELARAIRRVATQVRLDEIDIDTLRTLALSCAYRIEKLNGGAS